MRKLLLATTAAAFVASAGSAFAEEASATFDATATTQAAISVSCGTNLRFGTLSVHGSNAEATVTVGASDGGTASSSNTSAVYAAAADSGNGACTISNETGGDATASLAGSAGTFSGTTLSGTTLSDGTNTLSADIELSKAANISSETIYVGGTLTIPANHTNFGAYSDTITLTVTD